MKLRRWFGVVLVAWAALVPLLVNVMSAAPAEAASFYTVHDSTTIWKTQGTCVIGNNMPFFDGPGKVGPTGNQISYPAGTFAASHLNGPRAGFTYTAFEIKSITYTDPQDPKKGYDATIADVQGANNTCHLNGQIHIDNPNGVKLKDVSLTATPPTDNGGNAPTDCNAGDFTWFICGAINAMSALVDWVLKNVIIPFLKIAPLSTKDPLYKVWSAFRNVASIFFILVFFLVIFGTAIGFDNYTVKRMLPRLVAGAILVPFSWYICTIIIDIGNIAGQGLLSLGGAVLPPPNIDLTSIASQGIFVTLAVVGAGIAWTMVSWALIITIVISVAVFFVTMLFRQVLVYILVATSPFAVLAWILPNTQGLSRTYNKNFIRVVAAYPAIILLFVGGQLGADVAGTLGGANQNLTTFFALAFLFGPLFLAPTVLKNSGAWMAMGANAVSKFGNQFDKRYGKDSDWAKDRAAYKEHQNLQRMDQAERNGQGLRAAYFRSRSGTGKGFAGFGRGNKLQDLSRNQQAKEALGTESKINARNRTRQQGIRESYQAQLEAETLKATKALADERGERAGLLLAERQKVQTGRTTAQESYLATRENSKRTISAEIGKARGTIDAAGQMYQHGSVIGQEARFREQGMQAMERGKIARSVQTVNAIDAQNQTLYGMTPGAATAYRMRTTRDAAGIKAQEEISTLWGQNERQVIEEGQAPESVATQVAAASLEERKRMQDARAARSERVRVQNSARGYVSDAEGRAASQIVANEHIGEEAMRQHALLTGEATAGAGETQDERLEGQYRQQEGKVMDEINARRQQLRAENEDAQAAGAFTPDQMRQHNTDRRQQASAQTAFLAANTAVGDRTGVISDMNANPGLANTTPGAGARVRNAAAYNKGKQLGAQSGAIRGTLEAAAAEAAQNGYGATPFSDAALAAAAGTSAEAAQIKTGREKAKAYSEERNLIAGQRENPVSVAEVAEQAQREGELAAAAENATTLGKLEEAREAEQKEINASGGALTPDQARSTLMRQAASKANSEARDATATSYEETAGAVRGRRIAREREIARSGGTAADAERRIIDRGARIAGQNKQKEVSQADATNVGTETIRNQAVQDLMDTGLTQPQAEERLAARAYDSARITGEDKETDVIADEEGTAGTEDTAIDIYLDEQNSDLTEAQRAAIRADPTARADAARAIRRTNRQARSRTTGNARTGKITENRGIIESRGRAVKRLQDLNPGMTEDDAYRTLDRNAHAKIYKDAADKYNKDIGEEQGTKESMDEKLRDEMNPTGAPPLTREQAMQRMANKTIDKAREAEAQKVSGEYGELDSTVAGIQEERERVAAGLLGLDLNDPNPATRALNRTLVRNHLNTVAGRNQVAMRMRMRSRQAGAETGARTKGGDTGKTEALVQAHNAPNRPTEEDRADASTKEQVKAVAGESAGIIAHQNEALPTVDPATQFADAFRARSEREGEKVIDEAMADAGAGLRLTVTDPTTGNVLADNVPLKDLKYSPAEIQAVRAEIDAAFTRGDIPTAMAAIEHLATGSSTAQRELVDWSNPNSVVRRWFGGNDNRSVSTDPSPDPTRPNLGDLHPQLRPQMQTLWDRAIKNGRDPDLKLPPEVVMDKIGPDQILSGSDRWKGRLVSYITDPSRDAKAAKHQQQMADGIVTAITNPTKRGQMRNPDFDNLHRFILRRSDGSGAVPAGVLLDNAGNPIRHINPATGADIVDPRTGDAFVREYIERPGEMSAPPDSDYDAARADGDPATATPPDPAYAAQFAQYRLVLQQNTDEDPDAPAPVPPATRRRTKAESVIETLKAGHRAEGTP